MRFFEAEGEIRKSISVIKTRTSDHERSIREFKIDQDGISIGEPLRGFSSILSGSPVYNASKDHLMALRGDDKDGSK